MKLKQFIFALVAMLSFAFSGFAQTVVTDAAGLKNAVSSTGAVVTLGDNITVAEAISIPKGITVTLDLNGKSITGTHSGYVFAVAGTLNINDSQGTGTVTGRSSVLHVQGGGNITLNAGKIYRNSGLVVYTTGRFVVNGGSVKTATTTGTLSASNSGVRVAGSGTIQLNGGTVTSLLVSAGNLNITGSDVKVEGGINVTSAKGVNITAGDIDGNVTIADGVKSVVSVSGGNFEDAEAIEEFLPDGSTLLDKGDGTFEVVAGMLKIGDTYYPTLEAALTAAKDGDTVELLSQEGAAPIAMNGSLYGKSVTITGTATVDWSKGFLFVARGGEGNATLTFDNANLTSASDNASTGIHVSGREKNTNNKYDGTVVIKNSTIELDYLINKGAMTLDNSSLTVKNGFDLNGRPASETESGEDANATLALTNNSKLVVNNHNGMGIGREGKGELTVDASSTFEHTQDFLVCANGTMDVKGTLVSNGKKLTNNGEVKFTATKLTAATIDGTGTTRFYNDINFYGANSITTGINGTPFHLVVNEGANLFITRFVLGYDRNITVNGTIADASAFNPEGQTPSLKFNSTSGVSVGGTGTGNLTVKNAYVELGSSSWKEAQGTYDWDFVNSYVSATSFTNATGADAATWDVTFDNSVLAAKNYIKNGKNVTYNFTNNSRGTTGSLRIDGVLNIDATSSVVTTSQQNNKVGAVDEHGGINGTVNVAGNLTIGSNAKTQLEVLGGTVNVNEGATLALGNNTLTLDATSAMQSAGNISGAITAADGADVAISGGKYTQDVNEWCIDGLMTQQNADGSFGIAPAAAKVGTKNYASLAAAYEAAVNGDVIVLYESVTTFPVINKAVTFKGGKENAAVEINYALSQNFTAINGTVRFENLTFNKPLFTEHGGNKPGLSIEFEGCNFNVNSEAGYGILIGTSWSNSVVKGLKVNNCNFKYVGDVFKGGYMLYVQCVNEVTITNNTIDGNNLYRGAIHLGDATEHATVATVSNNTIKNFCRGVMMGNRVAGSSATISGNTFDNINYSDKDSKPAHECAPIFIHSNATSQALKVALTDNKVENCTNPMIYSEDTDLIKYYVTEFTGNTVDGTAVELANSYNAPNQVFPVATINGAEYFTLQAAINAVKNGETIVLARDFAENVTVTEKAGLYYTIDGNGKKMNGTITVSSLSDTNDNRRITIKNINFVTTEGRDFITSTATNHYPRITVEGCSFTGTGKDAADCVAIRLKSAHSVVIKDCTGTGLHSFLQNTSGWNLTIENVTVTESKSAFALGTVQGVTVKGCTADVDGYGIRMDAQYNNNAVLENNTVEAFIPVVVRKASVESNIAVNGTNTMTATNTDGIWFAAGTSEYEENGQLPTATTAKVLLVVNDDKLDIRKAYGNYVEPVAKVGDKGYGYIEDAIAAWTHNTTLTLLADVTLSEVIKLKSTEHHYLELATYTMTAAEGKNAIEIVAYGTGDAERGALTITADANNPGGINAGNKSIVYYDYSSGQTSGTDRPIIYIKGGVFTGSTSSLGTYGIHTKGTEARKCATLDISGGTFNCSIYGSGKSKLLISGGVFNYSVGSQGDSTALRLISGGTFKTFGFMTADSNNTKFWFGTAMGTSNVGVHVDDNGYIVVGGPVVTEPGETFEASSTNYSGASNLLQYSSAKNNGLYYTAVEEALKDNSNKTNAVVTVYADEVDMSGINYKGTIIIPAGGKVTITNAPADLKVVTTEGNFVTNNNGVYESKVAVAKIGETKFATFAEALAEVEDGQTITLIEGITGDEKSKEIEFTKDIKFTITGKAPQYALPVVTFQNAEVTIKDAEILIPELDARQNAVINVVNSTVHDAGGNSIAKSYYNGTINIDATSTVYMMQITTMGYINVAGTVNATWQTNVYGNGIISLAQGAKFNTGALHLTGKDYSGRDNTDADRVGKPATIVVDGATLNVGSVKSDNGSDYSYNSKDGINVGTIDGKLALLDVKNGGAVNFYMANGQTTNFGAGATVNVAASTLKTISRDENGTVTLANNGVVNVTGASNLNIKNFTGNAINATNTTLADVQFGGNVNAFGTNNISGTSVIGGVLSLGYGTNPTEQVVVNITGNFNGNNVLVYTNNGVDNILNVGKADGERTTVHFGQLGAFADVNVVNTDVTYGYAFIRNDFNATNSTFEIKGGVNTYFSGNAKVVLDNTTWALPGYANIGSYGGYMYGNADVTLKNGSSMTATNLGVEVSGEKVVKITLEDSSSLTATKLTNQGSIVLASTEATLTSNKCDNVTTNVANQVVSYIDGKYTLVAAVAKIGDVLYTSLQAAIDAVKDGETITLIDNVTEDVLITQRPSVDVVLDGNGKTFKGLMKIEGAGNTEGPETLTIQNVNFVANAGAASCILVERVTTNNCYSHNLTFANCTFTDEDGDVNCVAIRQSNGGCVKWTIDGCTVDSTMHSLLNVSNVKGLVVKNCTVESKHGLNLNNSWGEITVAGNNFNVKGYALRAGDTSNNNMEAAYTLEGNTMKSAGEDPVIVIRKSAANASSYAITKNVISGDVHISGNTASTKISADANYWDGKEAPVTSGTEVAVNSYYKDEALQQLVRIEKGSIYAYVYADRIFGDVTTNAAESLVVEIIGADGTVIGTSTLEKPEHRDGTLKTLTWRINFGADDSGSWAMQWNEGAPSINNIPAKVRVMVDGKAMAEAAIKYTANGDGQSPVVAAKNAADGKFSFVVAEGKFNLDTAAETLNAAIAAGDNVAILAAGTYKVPTGKDLTITGAVEGVEFANIGAHNMGGANVTFNNVTFTYASNSTYKGLQHAGNLVYNNCTFNGQVFLYGQSETFNKCTFNTTDSANYNVWTYGAKNVAFNECTFNSAGKSVLIYNESASVTNNVTVTKSQFIASQAVEGKAAIEMDSSISGAISLTIDGETTASGFAAGNVSGNSLWNNKKGNADDANNDITVVVNGETVLAPIFEAQIGDVQYRNLQDAINAVQNGETITMLLDATGNITLTEKVGLHYTLDGADKTMNGKIVITPLSDENDNRRITIKDINFVNTADAAVDFISCAVTNHYPRLTVKGCTFTGNGKDVDVALRLKTAYGAVIEDCTGTGLHSFLQNSAGKNLTIKGVTVTNSKSAFALGTVQGVTVQGVKVDVKGYGIRLDANTYNNNAVIEDNAIKAFIPVVVRNVNTTSNVIFAGKNEFTAGNTDGKWCVIGTTEYEENGKLPAEVAAGNVVVTLKDEKLTYDGIHGAGLAGKGTAEAPYLINNVAELEIFRNSVNAGSTKYNAPGLWVALNADIDLANAEWTVGIGDGHNYSFDGNFDGKKHTIKNLNIKPYADADNYICGGLFGYTYGAVTIKNLTIENAKVEFTGAEDGKTYHNVGILVGFANNKDGKLNVDNVTVKGDIKVDAPQTYGVGAIVGYSYRNMGAITNTKVLANAGSYINGQRFVGGITGYSYNGAVIDNCTVENLAITGEIGVGGIAGLALDGNKIAGCTVKYVTVNGDKNVAYIVGELGSGDGGNVTVADNCNAPQPWVGGSYGTGESFVATIGTQYYTSVAKAIEAAKENDVITLIADIAATDIITINKPVTLDGNGKTLTSTAGRAINVDCAGNVGIKNLTIDAKDERAINVIQKPANLTIDNVKATAANYTVNLAGSAAGAVVVVNNSNLTGLNVVNVAAAGAEVTVKNTTINTVDNNAKEGYSSLALNKDAVGGKIIATGVTINITGSACDDSVQATNAADGGEISINGSTDGVDIDVAAVEYGNYYYGFTTIEAAIEHAEAGQTVKLVRDVTASAIVTINKAITLDGNGKTLTSTAGRAINVETEGNVTIKNLTINAKGERAINIINFPANVTVNNVTATAKNNAVMMATSATGANLTVNNSDFTGLAVVNVASADSEVVINNTNITNVDANENENYGAISIFKTATNATVVVNGGKVVVDGDSKAASIGAAGATVTFNGTEGNPEVQTVVAYIGDAGYTTLKEAVEDAKAGETITLIGDVEATEVILLGKSLTINGNGHKVTSNATRVFRVTTSDTKVTLNDVNMVSRTVMVYPNDIRGISIDAGLQNVELTLNNCSVDFTDATACDWAYAVNVSGNGTGHTVTVNGGTYEGANVINVHGANNTVTVKDATLTSLYPNNDTYYGACIWVLQNQNTSVEAAGNTFNGDNAYAFNLGNGNPLTESDNTDNTKYVVAKIGDAYYTSIQDAIEAAQDGETVRLIQNVKMDTKTLATQNDGYAVLVNVNGKKVTIDLNGKKITVNAAAADLAAANGKMLLTVFHADTNGELTLTDNTADKAGAVVVNVNDATVYSVFASESQYTDKSESGKLTVNAGNYTTVGKIANAMFFTDANEVITVNGGNFHCDGATTTSSNPWIFNTLGNNELHVTVNGGTFNVDINHQHRPFEVYVPETLAVKANGNGTWTVVSAEAYITEMLGATVNEAGEWGRKVGYATLAEAMAAVKDGQTITLVKDITYTKDNGSISGEYVDGLVYTGDKSFTLDFNGKTITENGDINDYLVYLKNTGEKDNEITFMNGTIAVKSESENTAWAAITVGSSSATHNTVLNLNGMKVVNGNPNDAANQVIRSRNGAVVNLNEGTVVTSNGTSYGVIAENTGTVNINKGAKVVHTNSKTTGGNQVYTAVSGNGTINVYDGAEIVSDNYGIHNMTTGNAVINIYGGTIEAKVAVKASTNGGADQSATVSIEGGNFKGALENYTDAATIVVKGGTFDAAVATKYVAIGYICKDNGDGTFGVIVDPKHGMVAQIIRNDYYAENQYFATINDAVQAAVTGETVTLIADVETSAAKLATVGKENYAVLVAVKEKEITLDLNGKSVTVNPTAEELATAEGKMLMSVFGMDTNGKLTLTGNGSVKVNANGANVYSLVAAYGEGSAVVIENGNYEADAVMSSGSLIYSHELITVMGGTFNLGNLATGANGSPWIFNTIGQNYTGVKVVGGTYPTDINHQFWANEVLVPEAYALKNNGDGTWTVVDAVAYTNEKATSRGASWRHVGYASLEDAIAATGKYNCQNNVVTLIKDFAMEPITVANGVKVAIDLNGMTISATDNSTATYCLITNKGDLTINGTGAITLTANNERGWGARSAVISNEVGGKLTVNGGTIQHCGGTSMAYAIDNLTNGKGTYAETIINGGEIKSTYRPIRMFLNGVEAQNILTVNAGTIESTGGNKAAIWMQTAGDVAHSGTLYVGADAVIKNNVYLDADNLKNVREYPVEAYIAKAALAEGMTVLADAIPAETAALVEYDTFWQVEQKNLAELTIEDACEEYINKIEKNVGELTYERYFDDTEWQTIVLPFNVPVANLMEQFEVAYIYNASYMGKQATIEYVVIEDSEFVLAANYPYMIRAKEAGWNNIVVKNAKLMPTKVEILDCSSIFEQFSFIGNYATVDAGDLDDTMGYFSLNGAWSKMETINPFRFYMQIKLRNGAAFEYPAEAQAIRMRSVNANGETTGIDGVDAEQAGDFIFDLHGRRVLETEKGGIYIKGGKKFIAQ